MMKFYNGILVLALVVDLVLTPEQRANLARQMDWDRYASRFSD